nr:TDIFL3MR2 [Panicum virgatum]
MAAAGIDLCSRIVLTAAAAVIVLALLAAPASAREVPDGNGSGRYELMERQRVSTQHGVPSGPNPGSNLSPPLPPRDVAVEANGGHRYELMKQQHVSTQHDVPSGPNPGSNLSPRLPPPHDIVRP